MTGTFRFFLATLVVLSHLVNTPFFSHLGFYAVRAFFILSSFAMTAALNEHYEFDGQRFWMNRFLRLAPTYFATCLLTAAAIALFPTETAHFMPRWAFPATAADVLQNIFIVPIVFFGSTHLVYIEPAWSLAVEIIMYAALWLFVSRSAKYAFFGFLFGFYYHLALTLNGASFEQRYFSVEGAILSFSIGALAYFWRRENHTETPVYFAYGAIALWVVHLLAEGTLAPIGYPKATGFYINVLLAAFVVIMMPAIKLGKTARMIDRALGDLSYPVFLVQWLGGFIGYMLLSGAAMRGWTLVLFATAPIMLLASALAWAQERFFEPLRMKIRYQRRDRQEEKSVLSEYVMQPAE